MNDTPKQPAWWEPALLIFGKVSAWVAIPVVGALFLGKYLDRHFGTEPWMFIGTMAVAFAVSLIAIARICIDYIHTIEKEARLNDTIVGQAQKKKDESNIN